jgi:hypothetical protein
MAEQQDASTYAEVTIAAILTIATIPPSAAGHTPDAVVNRYKEVLQALRASGDAFNKGAGLVTVTTRRTPTARCGYWGELPPSFGVGSPKWRNFNLEIGQR